MKRILIILAAIFCFAIVNAEAQEKGQMAAGVNFNLGAGYGGGYSNFGIGAKFQYSFTDHIRVEPAFTYYFKKDYLSMWDFFANVHYVFGMANDKLNLYPLAGIGVLGAKASVLGYSASNTNFGVNLGGGVEYKLSDKFALGAEIKYAIVGNSYGHLGVQIGATYLF